MRRLSRPVLVAHCSLGANSPILTQSMLAADSLDTTRCVREALRLAEGGCELIRLAVPTKRHAANLEHIAKRLRAAGCTVPLIADVHFLPDAATEAAKWVDKVRINPGNYVDRRQDRISRTRESDEQAAERIRKAFLPLVRFCKEHGRAIRLGANHGSLSPRITAKYGDTAEGMVQSALEYERVAWEEGFHNLVFSMKASNVKLMIEANRLLVKRLDELGDGRNYPIHLGVTEAGAGEDGRLKSAIGIGTLLADGIGDTLRVSLTEDPIAEIEPGRELAHIYDTLTEEDKRALTALKAVYRPQAYRRRESEEQTQQGLRLGAEQPVRVVLPRKQHAALTAGGGGRTGERPAELCYEDLDVLEVDPTDPDTKRVLAEAPPTLAAVKDGVRLPLEQAQRMLAAQLPAKHCLLLKDTPGGGEGNGGLSAPIAAGMRIGTLLADGYGDAILIRSKEEPQEALDLAYDTLQAAGARISKTEFISCPSCGRTLYNIREAAARIRAAVGDRKGLKIAVMGCIVNGPGEMADADFGYVGGAPGKINLYAGHTPVKINIPEEKAVEELVRLLESTGKGTETAGATEAN